MPQSTFYLITEQHPKPPENLPEVLKELSDKHQLDTYNCRQRLIGHGLSLLTQGERERLEKISASLKGARYPHWLVASSNPEFEPDRILNLRITAEQIIFGCRNREVVFARGATILAVLAEMSGELAEKSLRQLLSSRAYRGVDDIRPLNENDIRKAILEGRPVLDLYRLDSRLLVQDAVRIFPGRFDPKGLGERAAVVGRQNLETILKRAEEYAGTFKLFTDFGLVNLPGCTLNRDDIDNAETQRKNLVSLTRYGWLMADVLRAGPIMPPQRQGNEDLSSAVAAALLMQNPALAADGTMAQVLSAAGEIAKEIDAAAEKNNKPDGACPGRAEPGLLPPPPAQAVSPWSRPGLWVIAAGAAAFMGLGFLSNADKQELLDKAAYHAFASGAIPAFIAILTLWYGFYLLRMKRRIENTPTSRIRSVAMGMVEVKGKAIRKYALVSPMTQTSCVFYRLTRYRRDKNNRWAVSSVRSSDNVPFFLEDATGRIEINPAGCRVEAGTKQEGAPGQVGLMRLRLNNHSDEKWVEEIIVEGTLLYVLGYASAKPPEGPTFGEQKIEALRELKRNPKHLQQFDANGDGKISEDEWDAARAAVEESVMHEMLENNQQRKKQEEHIVIGRKKGFPLIVAETHSEERLTARYLYSSIPLFLVAVASTVWAIHAFLEYIR